MIVRSAAHAFATLGLASVVVAGCGNGASDTGQGGGGGLMAPRGGDAGNAPAGGRAGTSTSGGSPSGTMSGAPALPSGGAGAQNMSAGSSSSGAPPLGGGGNAGTDTSPSGAGGRSAAGGSATSGGAANAGDGGASPGGMAGRSAMGGAGGASVTCTASKLAPGNSNRMLSVGGTSRTYILHVPAGYTGSAPVPLVLDFHGLGGSGMQQQSSDGYQAVADREGFLIAFPDGIDNAWNIGPCCTNSRDVDDLGFAKAMVASISADGCVDPQRVYATGFSMGGGMSQYLACNAADVFAAVAPASFDLLVPEEEPCEPSRPISVIAFRGTADTVVPFAGGKGSSGRVTFLGAQGSFDRWAEIDGCMMPTTTDGDCTYYEQCSGGARLGLCVKQGGSHAPGDANVGWEFLSRFTLP